jgi:hypothetical protein
MATALRAGGSLFHDIASKYPTWHLEVDLQHPPAGLPPFSATFESLDPFRCAGSGGGTRVADLPPRRREDRP